MEYIVPQKIKNVYMQNEAIDGNIGSHVRSNIFKKTRIFFKLSKLFKNEIVITDKRKSFQLSSSKSYKFPTKILSYL